MQDSWTRRDFLRRSGVAAGVVGLGATATGAALGEPALGDGIIVDSAVPGRDTIYKWIRKIYDQGLRRPGYPADVWAEGWISSQFRAFGLENVRFEPVPVQRWKPTRWSLKATPAGGESRILECFPVPYAKPVNRLELDLAAYDAARPNAVAGKASLFDFPMLRVPADLGLSTTAPDRVVDPDGTMRGATHVLPFGSELTAVMDKSIAAGASAFIGSLKDYPGDSFNYYVPYDAVQRPIPGLWIRGSDGEWLHSQLAAGGVRVKLVTLSTTEEFESNNVVGELPGADDEMVLVGSHHDGPWRSAVEDGSGISLVLAQAKYWASRPVNERPHRLVFLLQAGHMSGGAGLHTFIAQHRHELDQVVLEVHLEHAARELVENDDGQLEWNGLNVPRWFFTSTLPRLEQAVRVALIGENLKRCLILPPTAIGAQPPTDGGFYFNEGVPIVNFLGVPFYLFDKIDTPDKIDKDNLVPLTRATIRIIESTRGVSAAQMRTP